MKTSNTKEDIKCYIVGILLFVGFIVYFAVCIYFGIKNDQQREKLKSIEENEQLHDREILRSMYAYQKEQFSKIMEEISK